MEKDYKNVSPTLIDDLKMLPCNKNVLAYVGLRQQ